MSYGCGFSDSLDHKKKKNILETVLSPVFNYLIDHSSWQPVS